MLRRTFLATLALLVAFGSAALAQTRTVIDSAGRSVTIPDAPQRVLAAVLLYALAPEKMINWVRAPSAAEKAFLAATSPPPAG